MRIYSRFVFICNCCFILAVILRFAEKMKNYKGQFTGLVTYQPLKSSLVILGYGAIIVNAFFFVYVMIHFALKRKLPLPRWVAFFNLAIFPLQVYYFFFSNF